MVKYLRNKTIFDASISTLVIGSDFIQYLFWKKIRVHVSTVLLKSMYFSELVTTTMIFRKNIDFFKNQDFMKENLLPRKWNSVSQFVNPWFSAPSCCTASFREQQHSLTVYTWFSLPTVLPYSIVMPVTGPCFQTAADNTLAFLISIVKHFIPSWELSNKKKKKQNSTIILVEREPGSYRSTIVKLFLHFKVHLQRCFS